jgi:hypothetical protein
MNNLQQQIARVTGLSKKLLGLKGKQDERHHASPYTSSKNPYFTKHILVKKEDLNVSRGGN